MTALIQFIVLKRKGKWVVKSKDLERIFSVQQEAVDAAIRFANDSGKEGKPGVVLFQKSKSKFEKIWTYGQSPYPPPRSDLTPRERSQRVWRRARSLARKCRSHCRRDERDLPHNPSEEDRNRRPGTRSAYRRPPRARHAVPARSRPPGTRRPCAPRARDSSFRSLRYSVFGCNRR